MDVVTLEKKCVPIVYIQKLRADSKKLCNRNRLAYDTYFGGRNIIQKLRADSKKLCNRNKLAYDILMNLVNSQKYSPILANWRGECSMTKAFTKILSTKLCQV